MFIGGLNWETTDESLRAYFEQYGPVTDCMVMRDGATGRSRGFGFLTFAEAKSVNEVVTKEHYLDGKIVSLRHLEYDIVLTHDRSILNVPFLVTSRKRRPRCLSVVCRPIATKNSFQPSLDNLDGWWMPRS